MHTSLSPEFLNTEEGEKAKELISKCVHCGFCNATCPTYQLVGDELDGPRGRIYLMKEVFEGKTPTRVTQEHLDRCLTCRACETTCPSGVQYSQLLDLGKAVVDRKVERSRLDQFRRWAVREVVSEPTRFKRALSIGQRVKSLLPKALKEKLPPSEPHNTAALQWPTAKHERQMLVLEGCVQPALSPEINAAAARVLDRFGIQLVRVDNAGCCGAVRHHNDDKAGAQEQARRNIDAWWPFIDSGAVEAVVMTASGCGAEVQDYGMLLENDPAYSAKAQRVAELSKDISVIVSAELERLGRDFEPRDQQTTVAIQEPCTFQHALRDKVSIAQLMERFGYTPQIPKDAHLCCGSAGTYSIFQPELSKQLRANKLDNLLVDGPRYVATANIGCQTHLGEASEVPVLHWIELADQALGNPKQA
ncbi:MAG TPA: glycolate oxidase subunit GlcF [Paenalcaligenes sp.]|nr:glycolate oxidase subunit GlcF [Paenalcaligenes sp.]